MGVSCQEFRKGPLQFQLMRLSVKELILERPLECIFLNVRLWMRGETVAFCTIRLVVFVLGFFVLSSHLGACFSC